MNHNQTFYEVLEVDRGASQEEILKAFQRAKSVYSVNSPALYSVFSREEADELLKLINEAYVVLSNQTTRRNYDQSLLDKEKQTYAEPKTEPLSTPVPASIKSAPREVPPLTTPVAHAEKPTNVSSVRVESSFDEEAAARSTVRTRESAPPLDGSIGRTRFSTYEIDPQVEQEIANQEVFDGAFLQKIRNYKKLSLDQLSETSRIGRHYLIAVESNDFLSLPAPVFVRGFIVQFAKILGLNERKAVESYMRLYKQSRDKR